MWTGERLADGRPRVPDDILERMKLVTNDEAWGVLEAAQRLLLPVRGQLAQPPPRSRPGRPGGHRAHGAAPARPARGRRADRDGRGSQRRPEHLGDRHAAARTTCWSSISSARSTTAPSSATTWRRRPAPAPAPASSSTAASATTCASTSWPISRSSAGASIPRAIAEVTLVGVNDPDPDRQRHRHAGRRRARAREGV